MKSSLSILCGLFLFGIIAATAQEKTAKPGTKDAKGEADVTIGLVTFSQEFVSNEDKQDFQKLRRFLYRQQELLKELHSEKEGYYYSDQQLKHQESEKSRLDKIYEGLKKLDVKSDGGYEYVVNDQYFSYYTPYYGEYVVYEVGRFIELDYFKNNVLDEFEKYINELKDTEKIINALDQKIEITENNIYACEEQLSETLAPEYKRQEFRRSVSLNFTILIGVLLLGFFSIIYLKSDNSIGKEFLGDNGLQFVTLFVLVIAIILFGILGILEGRELAAILSGISGYILGKGLSKPGESPPSGRTESGDKPE